MPLSLANGQSGFAGHKTFDAREQKTVTKNFVVNKNLFGQVKTSNEKNGGTELAILRKLEKNTSANRFTL
jgi:hypothetical protein